MKSLTLFTLTLILTTALALLPATAQQDDVSIPDINLAAALREVLQLDEETPITAAALRELTEFDASSKGIADLTGLEHATQLTLLRLNSNTGVSDVSALANLTKLEELDLYRTRVSDVSALANLTQLRGLGLSNTGVSDISPLANLTQLTQLSLGGTDVSDVSALANLTKLTTLTLWDTDVSDVSALANLTQLETLSLGWTDVSDVSALANLTKLTWLKLERTDVSDVSTLANLTQLTMLELRGCPLSYASIHTHIPALQEKGIRVEFDNIAHPALLKIASDGDPGNVLSPFVVEATDEKGQPIVGKTILFENLQGGGTLSANTVQTDARGRAQVTLTLGETAGTNKVKASAEWIQSWVLFNTAPHPAPHPNP